jgi:hypothetical protein
MRIKYTFILIFYIAASVIITLETASVLPALQHLSSAGPQHYNVYSSEIEKRLQAK